MMHARKTGGSPGRESQDVLETGEVSSIVERASSGSRLPGFDLDPVTLKNCVTSLGVSFLACELKIMYLSPTPRPWWHLECSTW